MPANFSPWKKIATGACVFFAQLLLVLPVSAQNYPVRPVRLIVPWPPGGGVDIAARTLGPKLAENLGQPVVVDNRGGAAGMIGTELAARSPSDGYTILLGAAGPNAILPLLHPKAPYNALKDFTEVSHSQKRNPPNSPLVHRVPPRQPTFPVNCSKWPPASP